ncbi:DUF445 domain-containing protein [Corynebacterium liangguodongii]|uniref:DUF445 domain-containing protein n=1 Tax=Corynebacterium liangguodongii TaxID=2079535 RepID=A0A2S0WBY0_9CORY|nr:DUF445 family protein [Corynebacterium liangguodongii]AWB83266.1 DUF445 domain-containing protein [Corynebacterium liangguodongii]PWC00644.1 DUF445 domain-containing protein [Corynebacterium liangguodongii]
MSRHESAPAVTDAQRRKALRVHKGVATSLLGVMAAIFLSCSWWQSTGEAPAWAGYVRAAAEAGMVGGLADWFAVTALFRHPLGLPIPHTAIIPRRKDQVAGALSDFVSENFLNAQTITDKVAQAEVPRRVGLWLEREDNAELVSAHAGSLAARIVASIDPEEARRIIDRQVIDRVAEPEWGPHLGRALDGLIADGKVEPVIDDVISWARRKVAGMEDSVIEMIDERMPRWAPQFAKDLVGERVYRELVSFMREIDTDPNHEARLALRRQIAGFARDLQHDAATIARVEAIKADVMGSKAVTSASAGIWERASRSLIDAAGEPSSALRRKLVELCLTWGSRLAHDPQVQAAAQRRLGVATRYLAENGAGEIVGIISETIQRWDGQEAAEKIELMAGKDLQFIRLNGTIVGALAGLVIYSLSRALFF